jgi:hypothetical protein
MNKTRWLFVFLIASYGSGNGLATASDKVRQPEAPRWLTSWEEGRKVGRARGKSLFVVFRCEH